MIEIFISFLAIFIGYLIAKYTKEELKSGKIYFEIIQIIVLIFLIIILLFQGFVWWLFFLGVLIGLIIRYEYIYFSLGLINILNINSSFLLSSLIFIYGLSYGSLAYYKNNFKLLIYNLPLFLIPLLFYFFNYGFLSLAAGGLISIFIIKIYNLINRYL